MGDRKIREKIKDHVIALWDMDSVETTDESFQLWLKIQRIKEIEDIPELKDTFLNLINSEEYLREIKYEAHDDPQKPGSKIIDRYVTPMPSFKKLQKLYYVYGPYEQRPERTTDPDSNETYFVRHSAICGFGGRLEELETSGHSYQWKAMKAALERVKSLNYDIKTDMNGPVSTENKRKLSAAMEMLRRTAHNYEVYKLGKNWEATEEDKDFQRLKLARDIEEYCIYDLKQTEAVEEKENRKCSAAGGRYEKKQPFEDQTAFFKDIRTDFEKIEVGHISSTYWKLKSKLVEFCERVLPGALNSSVSEEDYEKKLAELAKLTDVYLEHKRKNNDAREGAMGRLEIAIRLRHFLTHLEREKAGKALADPYEAAKKAAKKAARKAAEKKPMQEAPEKAPAVRPQAMSAELKAEQEQMVREFKKKHGVINPDENICSMGQQIRGTQTYAFSNIPKEILITGDQEILKDFLEKNIGNLSKTEADHIKNRIRTMNYIDKMEEYYNSKEGKPKKISDKDVVTKKDGFTVLPVHLSRKQDNFNGCWGCAYSLMLQARGVNLDPTIIRRYRPKLSLGDACHKAADPSVVFIANSDTGRDILDYTSLMNKVCPNTVMKAVEIIPSYNFNTGTVDLSAAKGMVEKAEQFIYKMLLKKSPVAFSNGSHWLTIVGYNGKGQVRVVDSLNPERSDLTSDIDLNTYINGMLKKRKQLKFVAMDDLAPHKGIVFGKDDQEIIFNENDTKRDKLDEKGSKILDEYGEPKQEDFIFKNEMGCFYTPADGMGIIDYSELMTTYYPTMKRNFDVDYKIQKEAVQKKLMKGYKTQEFKGFTFIGKTENMGDIAITMDSKFTGKVPAGPVPQA